MSFFIEATLYGRIFSFSYSGFSVLRTNTICLTACTKIPETSLGLRIIYEMINQQHGFIKSLHNPNIDTLEVPCGFKHFGNCLPINITGHKNSPQITLI